MEKLSQRAIEETTRGHELYLRHLLLLLQAAPLALNGYICRKVRNCNENLADLIIENKYTFYTNYREEFEQLFQEDKINDNIDSWDVRLRCIVTLVLFHSESDSQGIEFEAIECILDQMKDLDNYVQSASLNYKTFEIKWKSLHDAIIELINEIDDESKFECKRMIHSYQPGSISISSEVIRNLEDTNDAKIHVCIALQNKRDVDNGNHSSYDLDELGKHGNVNFAERLQDKFVYVNEPTILTCKLNISERNVTWSHDNKQIENSDTMKKVKDGCFHWLAISRANIEDAGLYSCACNNGSTTAYLTVLHKPVMVTKELHLATEEAKVKENMDIVLICQVNLRTTSVIWRHNGDVMACNRHLISSNDTVHELTILKAQYEDEGEYTVDFGNTKSSTQLTLKGNPNLAHRKQLTNNLYKNWIRGALGLKYLKLGLEEVSSSLVKKHHSELIRQLSNTGITCTRCTIEQLLPAHKQDQCPKKSKCICSKQLHQRKTCPNGGFCSKLFDKVMFDHRFNEILLTNTDIKKWANDPWSVAKCYINTPGYLDKSSEKEIDCAGLLCLFINNTYFEKQLNGIDVNGETDVFKKARDTRNDILHSANYELSEVRLYNYLDIFINVLEAKDVNGKLALSCFPGTQEAKYNLNELRNNEIDISKAGEFDKQIQEMKDHALAELADKVQEATQQKNQKLQHVEERLIETEKELQLMRDLRSLQTKGNDKADSQVEFKLDLHLEVIEITGRTSSQGNLRILQSMKDNHSGEKIETDLYTQPTYISVQRLLEHIKVLESCTIADISNTKTTVVIKLNCSTCDAIESLLKVINGNEFQEEIIQLRKCLKIHEHLPVYDVIASCSSESLENTRKNLSERAQNNDITCAKHQGTQCVWYCSDHDEFFCTSCKDLGHSACIGLKQVISDRSYMKQKQSLIFQNEIGKYNVRKKTNSLFNRSDNDNCDITSIRMLPNGEILLVDSRNSRLKKLDRTYNIVSHCDIPHTPLDVCYIGNDRAAVSLWSDGIQFVNVSNKMKLEHTVKLKHECLSLACHGETLFVGDDHTIYRYNKDCQQKRVLYTYQGDNNSAFCHIVVSDDGEIIYISDDNNSLITIDKEGRQLSTLTNVMEYIRDVCVVGNGTVLVAIKSEGVYQVDYRGEQVQGTVIRTASVRSLCFDRQTVRLLVSFINNNYISVCQLNMQSTC